MTTNVRTQSTITNGQIGQINDRLSAKLRESGLPTEDVQHVLMMPGNPAIDEMVAVFRKHVEAQSDMIIRHVRVDRTRTPQEVVDAVVATGRTPYINKDVLATLPQGEGDEVDVCFFKVGRYLLVGEVMKEYERRGLVPDPRAQAAVNEADPAFADQHPNGTQWGNTCCLLFNRWDDERDVDCYRDDNDWRGDWWFAGVPAPRK